MHGERGLADAGRAGDGGQARAAGEHPVELGQFGAAAGEREGVGGELGGRAGAEPAGRRGPGRAAQDAGVQAGQFRSGFAAQPVGDGFPGTRERLQGLRRPPGRDQGVHEDRDQGFDGGVLGGERGEPFGDLLGAAQPQRAPAEPGEDVEPFPSERVAHPGRPAAGHPGQALVVPPVQGVQQQPGGAGVVAGLLGGARGEDEPPGPVQVDHVGGAVDQVSAGGEPDGAGAGNGVEDAAQPGGVRGERGGRPGWGITPDPVDQGAGRHHLAGGEQQGGEQAALFPGAEIHALRPVGQPYRPQQTPAHRVDPPLFPVPAAIECGVETIADVQAICKREPSPWCPRPRRPRGVVDVLTSMGGDAGGGHAASGTPSGEDLQGYGFGQRRRSRVVGMQSVAGVEVR
nr:hypothetical protein [Actinoplanes utahensis]